MGGAIDSSCHCQLRAGFGVSLAVGAEDLGFHCQFGRSIVGEIRYYMFESRKPDSEQLIRGLIGAKGFGLGEQVKD